jgi:hypothetical protein
MRVFTELAQCLPGSLLLCLWLMLSGSAAAQAGAGRIEALHGAGHIERNGRSVTVSAGMTILAGDKLQTSRQSTLTVDLIDGSQLVLSDVSTVVIDQKIGSVTDSIIELFNGKVRSIVTRLAGKAAGFEVHTPNAVVAVRGTDFETEFIEGKPCPGFPQCFRYTDVGVYKGIVEVRNPTSAVVISVRVAAGYETTVPCELPPAAPGPLGMGDLTAPGYH